MDRFEDILEVTLNAATKVLAIIALIAALLVAVTGGAVLFQEFFTGSHSILMEQLAFLGTYILIGSATLALVILFVLSVFDS